MRKLYILFLLNIFFEGINGQTFSLVTSEGQIDENSKYIFMSFSPDYSKNYNVYLVGGHNGTMRDVVKTDVVGIIDTDGTGYKIPTEISLSDIELSYIEFLKAEASGLWYIVDSNVRDTGSEDCYICRDGKENTNILLGSNNTSNAVWDVQVSSDGLAYIRELDEERRLNVSFTLQALGYYANFKDNLYIFKCTHASFLTTSRSSIQFYVTSGGRQTENINVSGKNLTGDITVEISGDGFSVDKYCISKDKANNASLAVTYTGGTNSTGTLTLKSDGCEDVVVALSAEIIEESPDFKFSSSEGDAYFTGVSSTYGTFPTLLYKGVNVEAGAVEYSSSDDMIATVDAETGKVTAHGVGDCTIVAKHRANGLKTSYTLNVTDKMYVRLKNVGDITSGEYVLIGQKAEDSFGVFDFDEYDDKKGYLPYKVYTNVLEDNIYGYLTETYLDKESGKYKVKSASGKYVGPKNESDLELTQCIDDNAKEFSLNVDTKGVFILHVGNYNRCLAPHSGSQNIWKAYSTSSFVYNDGYCLYLYRQALHVSSVTGRKLVLAGEWNSDVFSSIMDGCPEAAWIDLTSVTGMPNNVTLPSRENCIYVVTRDAFEKLKNTSNVVCEGKAEKIELTDGESPFCAYESFTATNVSYNRNFSGTTSTICLPFSCDIPEGVDVYEMTAFNDGHTVEFAKAASIEAYKPYIIRTTGTAFLNLTFGNSGYTFPAEPEEMSVSYDALSFCGTMSRQELRSDEFTKYYGYSSGKLQYVGVGKVGYVNPFRAYFVERSNDDLKTVDIVLYDVPASIESTEVGRAGFVDVYSIDGRLIKASVEEEKATDGLDKGIYIVGKRKVLVK